MTYLLDVNVLLALRYAGHVHHGRAIHWTRSLRVGGGNADCLATCAITELAFIRIAPGSAAFARDVSAALVDLRRIKTSAPFVFFGDALRADQMPVVLSRPRHQVGVDRVCVRIAHDIRKFCMPFAERLRGSRKCQRGA